MLSSPKNLTEKLKISMSKLLRLTKKIICSLFKYYNLELFKEFILKLKNQQFENFYTKITNMKFKNPTY